MIMEEERQPLLMNSKKAHDNIRTNGDTTFRNRLYCVMDGKNTLGRCVDNFLSLCILLNVLSFILSTEQVLNDRYRSIFTGVETTTVIIFSFEYMARLYACVESSVYPSHWLFGRVKYMVSFYSLVDLLAIVPWYVDLFIAEDLVGTQFIRILRLFRLLKSPYGEALTTLKDVFSKNGQLLATSGFVAVVVWVFAASIMHVVERDNEDVEDRYASIPKAMFYTLLNMFGEFPVSDFTPWGKFVGGVMSVFAVGVAAIPTGILGAGFMENIQEKRTHKNDEADEEDAVAVEHIQKDSVCSSCMDLRLQNMNATQRLYAFLEAQTNAGLMFERTIFGLIMLNVVAFMLETVKGIYKHNGAQIFFSWFEAFSVAIFTVEYILRIYTCRCDPTLAEYSPLMARLKYCIRFYSIVDLLAIVPFYVDLFLPQDLPAATFMRVLRLVRMLRAERYIEAFTVFDDVFRANAEILTTTGMAAMAAWVIFSSLMYICERAHVDANHVQRGANDIAMNVAFRSVPSSMWYTLLMLTGEFPLADFTSSGKWVAGCIGVVAVAIFAIPTGVLGAGFEEWVQDKEEARAALLSIESVCQDCGETILSDSRNDLDEESGVDVDDTPNRLDDSFSEAGLALPSYRKRLFLILEGRGAGIYVQFGLFTLILLNVITFILRTVPDISKDQNVMTAFDYIEATSVGIFTLEYVLRLYASVEDPEFKIYGRSDWQARANYLTSFFSIVDLCAILPFYIDLMLPNTDLIPTQIVRVLRFLLVLKFEQFAPALTLIDDVFRQKKFVLLTTGFVTVVVWVFFSTLLYLCERDDILSTVDYLSESQRFDSVPHSLPYTFVLLTGDYPLTEFNIWGKLTCTAMIVVAVGLVAIPSGAIAAGFADLVNEKRRVCRLTVSSLDDAEEVEAECLECRTESAKRKGLPARVLLFSQGNTPFGRAYEYFLLALIVSNMILFIYSTDEDAQKIIGSSFFFYFDAFCCLIFTVDYIVRVYGADANDDYNSRWDYCLSFFGIVDLLSFAPFWIILGLGVHHLLVPNSPITSLVLSNEARIALFDLYRLVRLFKIEHYIEAFTVLDNVFRRQKYIILVTTFVSVILWVSCASLLYLTQQDNKLMDGAYSTMPNALFFSLIALGGEWVKVDFNGIGFVICFVMCLLAIALFGIPAGIFFGGFQEILEDRAEQKRKMRQFSNCDTCGKMIQFAFHLPALANDD
eukprot:CFRG7328T1